MLSVVENAIQNMEDALAFRVEVDRAGRAAVAVRFREAEAGEAELSFNSEALQTPLPATISYLGSSRASSSSGASPSPAITGMPEWRLSHAIQAPNKHCGSSLSQLPLLAVASYKLPETYLCRMLATNV